MSLSLHFLIFLRIRQAEQMVDIAFRRNQFPHVLLDGAVLLVGGLFLRGELLPFGFERVHF